MITSFTISGKQFFQRLNEKSARRSRFLIINLSTGEFDQNLFCGIENFQPELVMIFGKSSEQAHDQLDSYLYDKGVEDCLTTWHTSECIEDVIEDFLSETYLACENMSDFILIFESNFTDYVTSCSKVMLIASKIAVTI